MYQTLRTDTFNTQQPGISATTVTGKHGTLPPRPLPARRRGAGGEGRRGGGASPSRRPPPLSLKGGTARRRGRGRALGRGRPRVEAGGRHPGTSGGGRATAAPLLGAAPSGRRPPVHLLTCRPAGRGGPGPCPATPPQRARRRRPSGYRRQGAATWRSERRRARLHNNSGSGERSPRRLASVPSRAVPGRAEPRSSAAPAPPAPRRGGGPGWAAFG